MTTTRLDNGSINYQNKMNQLTWAPVTDAITSQKIINEIQGTIGSIKVETIDILGNILIRHDGTLMVNHNHELVIRGTN
jgi:hypothetical protein